MAMFDLECLPVPATAVVGNYPAGSAQGTALDISHYGLPVSFRADDQNIRSVNYAEEIEDFLSQEFNLGELDRRFVQHLWYAGSKRCAMPLHEQLALGRFIVPRENIRTHLTWSTTGKLFIKPLPRYLLNRVFWSRQLICHWTCGCSPDHDCDMRKRLKVIQGFLYSYACLLSYRCDFSIAIQSGLLLEDDQGPLISWNDWKRLASEIIRVKHADVNEIHPRFHRAELRMSRLDILSRIMGLSVFESYSRGRRSYGVAARENIAWMAAGTVFVALALTAFQTGLAVPRLADNAYFVSAAYGFVLFALIGPVVFSTIVILYVLSYMMNYAAKVGRDHKRQSSGINRC